MIKVETHNNSKEYYENLTIEKNAYYIFPNTSLSNMLKEVSSTLEGENWRVLDIENFINLLYPEWNKTINIIRLKNELRKEILKLKNEANIEEIKELKFLEDNIEILSSDLRFLFEAGVREISNEDYDLKLNLIKRIFNNYIKNEQFEKVSAEVNDINSIIGFETKVIRNYLKNLKKQNEEEAKKALNTIKRSNIKSKKIYFYNINYLDLKRFLTIKLLNLAGYETIFRIPYFKELTVVNKCWDMIYKNPKLFHIKIDENYYKANSNSKYVDFLEGKVVNEEKNENIKIKNYREISDFKKEFKIQGNKKVITFYKGSLKACIDEPNNNNKISHCYESSIGRFIKNIYNCKMQDEQVKIDFSTYRELITSGWIEYRGWNGLRLTAYLSDNEEYFSGVKTIDEIIERIKAIKDIEEVSDVFEEPIKERIKKNELKRFLSNPFRALSYANFEKYGITPSYMLDVSLKLKRFLLKTFEEENEFINIKNHLEELKTLYKNNHITSLFKNRNELDNIVLKRIWAVLNKPEFFGAVVYKQELSQLFNVYLNLENNKKEEYVDFSIDQLEGLVLSDNLTSYKGEKAIFISDLSFKAYDRYLKQYKKSEKILSKKELSKILEKNLKGINKEIAIEGFNLQEISEKAVESYIKFSIANLFINFHGYKEFSWIEGLRKDDNKSILLNQLETLYGNVENVVQVLDLEDMVSEEELINRDTFLYDTKEIINESSELPEVAYRDLDFCGDKFLYSSILNEHPIYYSDFHHKLVFSSLVSMFKNSFEDGYNSIFKYVLPLFPQWKAVVKKNVLDCEYARRNIREYKYFSGINYPKNTDILYILRSKYIVTENSKIRNRYNKEEFLGEKYYSEFVKEFLNDESNNSGYHCKMCPHSYLCKKGDFLVGNK